MDVDEGIFFRVSGAKLDKKSRLSNASGTFADEEEAKLFYGFLVGHGYGASLQREETKTLRRIDPLEQRERS